MKKRKVPSDAERAFIKKWQRESGKWLDLNVFNAAADTLALTGRELHVDIASGNGAMLSVLRKKHPQMRLFGAERYTVLLALAGRNFKESDIPFTIYDKDGTIGFSYPEKGSDYPNESARITLVRDRIQELLTLRKLLHGEQVDTASFMLPGISKASVLETVDLEGTGWSKKEMFEVMGKVRGAVCRHVSELVRPGGRFVMVEKTSCDIEIENITNIVMSKMCGYERYWDPFDRYELFGLESDEEDVTTGITWVDSIQQKEVPKDDSLFVIIQSFKRNDERLEPEPDDGDQEDEKSKKSVIFG
jgi:hypothetical protein